jgi:hypothetical protein
VDHADTRLESSAQSVRHPVRRQGAGVNTSYTVNLTPPALSKRSNYAEIFQPAQCPMDEAAINDATA